MLARTLEPEVMETEEDAEEYDAMDFGPSNGTFASDAKKLLGEGQSLACLDIGTGTADIPLRLLELGPNLRVVAVDMSKNMLEVAKKKASRRGLADRLELRLQDAKGLDLGAQRFDLVMSNSVAHHIPDPTDLFREIKKAVHPDGAILVRDLIRPGSIEEARAIVERVSPNDSKKQKQLFLDSLCAALTLEEVRQITERAGLGDLDVRQVSDRHWSAERGRKQG